MHPGSDGIAFGCIGPRSSREDMFQEEHQMPMKKKAKKKKH
jgi:hypothetical protein